MFGTRPEIVCLLRCMANGNLSPSEMLKTIVSRHLGETLHKVVFYRYFTEAFCFDEGEASPLFGWLPDGTGELQDVDIDRLRSKRIEKSRTAWESMPMN